MSSSYEDFINSFAPDTFLNSPKVTNTIPDSSNKGFNLGDLENISKSISALSGLANAFTAFKNYGLANKQFNFEKQAYNTNLANQTQMINNDYINRAKIGLALSGMSTANDTNLTQAAKGLVGSQLLPTRTL